MVFSKKIILVVSLIVATIIQIIPVVRSGLHYPYGYGFWGPNGHDGIWHLSLVNHIANPQKIEMPTFSGELLANYHPLFDILLSYLSRLTLIPSAIWLFQIFPIISSIVYLYLSFLLGKLLTKSFSGGLLLLWLNATSNSLGWLVSIFKNGTLGGESIFWAMQSPSNQINPPFNLSLIFILILLLILLKSSDSRKLSMVNLLYIFTILSLLPITKAYSAVVGFGYFGIYSLMAFFLHKNYKPALTFILSIISAFVIFLNYNSSSGSLLVFKPFWFINSMIESPDRIFIPYLANMRYSLESSGVIGPRLILLWTFTFTLFVFGNFGWRLLGIHSLFRLRNPVYYVFTILIVILTTIPTLFIQKGTSWNTIQFLYYALFLGNILLATTLHSISSRNIGKLLIVIIFISNLLGIIGMAPNYLGAVPPTAIPSPEMNALKFLASQPKGVVLTVPYDQFLKTHFTTTPIPLYAYETTSYVSAYSRHLTFVDDYMNLINSGYDYAQRLKASADFFSQKNINQDRGFLLNNNISYIYLTGIQRQFVNLSNPNLFIKLIFENQETTIYQVLK